MFNKKQNNNNNNNNKTEKKKKKKKKNSCWSISSVTYAQPIPLSYLRID